MNRVVGTMFGCLALFLALAGPSGASAASLQVVGNFARPIYVTSDPGNPNRLFVVEREGQIVVSENGTTTEFVDLRSLIGSDGGSDEGGLLSIALSPDFDTSGRFFVDYTDTTLPAGSIHVAELQSIAGVVSLATLRNLLTIPHPTYRNHYGGQLQFGPEGDLYISTGDGGNANDEPGHNAQSKASLLGKILRLAPGPFPGAPYTVPPSNPFVAELAAPYSTIFNYGLRNPYRFSFDRLTHDLVIGDVGQDKREEVDWGRSPTLGGGADYGWNCFEGKLEGPATDPQCTGKTAADFTPPAFEYPHENPGGGAAYGQAIIGGYVSRDPGLGSLYGRYLYGDFGTGELRSLSLAEGAASDRSEGLTVANLNSFGEDSCGRLYAVSGNGPVDRLVGPTPTNCASATTTATAPLSPASVGIRAITRRVRHNGRAQLTVWVSPCAHRFGDLVQLWQGARKLGGRRLDRACTARFLPRVHHKVKFRAIVPADSEYLAATSRKLGIRIFHPKRERGAKPGGRLHIPPGVGHR